MVLLLSTVNGSVIRFNALVPYMHQRPDSGFVNLKNSEKGFRKLSPNERGCLSFVQQNNN